MEDLVVPVQGTCANKSGTPSYSSSSRASSHKKVSHATTDKTVRFANPEDNSTHVIEKISDQDVPYLWYTRQDFDTFRFQAWNQAQALGCKQQQRRQSTTNNDHESWSDALRQVFQACCRAGCNETIISSQLRLRPEQVNEETIGLECLAISSIARSLESRRNHLLDQIDRAQYEMFVLRKQGPREATEAVAAVEAMEESIAHTSIVCSRAARLFAQNLAQMAAISAT